MAAYIGLRVLVKTLSLWVQRIIGSWYRIKKLTPFHSPQKSLRRMDGGTTLRIICMIYGCTKMLNLILKNGMENSYAVTTIKSNFIQFINFNKSYVSADSMALRIISKFKVWKQLKKEPTLLRGKFTKK